MKFGTVAILGCPNVGKSTLVNTLVHHKISIVSDTPQTTRARILGVAHCPQGQLAVLDTPGLRAHPHRLKKRMARAAWSAVDDADLLAVMVDGSRRPGTGDRFVAERVFSAPRRRDGVPVFLLVNKIDAVNRLKLLPVLDAYQALAPWTEIVPLSARTGRNVDRMTALMFDRMTEGDAAFDDDFVTDQSWRRLAAETIREKVIDATTAELPHAVAVQVEEFLEEGRLTRVAASIFVERPGQKAIVIGRAGARLRAIGAAARRELSRELERKVFLRLHVKVKEAWCEDDRLLAELGY